MVTSILSPDTADTPGIGPPKRLSKMPKGDRIERLNRDLRRMRNHTGQWRRDAKDYFNIYAGDQWDDDDRAQLKEALRPVITYNRVQPIIDAIAGTEINNREEVRYIPRTQGDAQVNEILTGAAEWSRDLTDASDEETDAFIDDLICGMGWTETRIVYDEDPDGLIDIARVDPLEMYWDTASKKRNLADAKMVARVKDYDEGEFAQMWPKMVGKIAPMSGQWDEGWTDDEGEAHFNDEIGYVGEAQDAGFDQERRVFKVVEVQWYELEPYYRTLNPDSGKIEELSIPAGNRLKPYLDQFDVPLVKQFRRRYFREFLVGFQQLEFHDLPIQTGFTYNCITGKRDRNKRTWYGVVKSLKDPQMWANKFFSTILHIISTNARGGLLAESNAFQDPDEAEANWAAPDSITWLQDGALSGGNPRVIPKPPGTYPEGTERLMNFSMNAFREVTGVNLEMLGQADANNRSGVLEYQRKEAALVILAPLFDSLRRYRKIQGRILLEYIQKYLSDGRLIRIMGKEGFEQYVPLIRDKDTIRYDVIVDEAPSSPNQKQRVFEVLTVMLPALLQAGIPIPPDILDYTPLPSPLVQKWKEMMVKPQGDQGPDPEQMKAQGSMMKDQSMAELNKAKSQTEGAKQQQAMAGAKGVEAQTMAQVARIAELTPVDAAQAEHFEAKRRLEDERTLTENVRQQTMLSDAMARKQLSEEKEDTEEARQAALRSQTNGSSGS